MVQCLQMQFKHVKTLSTTTPTMSRTVLALFHSKETNDRKTIVSLSIPPPPVRRGLGGVEGPKGGHGEQKDTRGLMALDKGLRS